MASSLVTDNLVIITSNDCQSFGNGVISSSGGEMAKLTPQACRAGRALLGWGVRDLARESGLGVATIARLEAGDDMRADTLDRVKQTFADNGVEITNGKGTGARLVRPMP
jgi:hypothetical protein